MGKIEKLGAPAYDVMHDGLDGFGHESLQDVAFNRQAQARHGRDMGGMAGDGDPHLVTEDLAARCFNTRHAVSIAQDRRHFTVLDDMHTKLRGGAGIAPGHGIMANGSGTGLVDGAIDRPARVFRIVEIGQKLHHFAPVQQFGVDAVEPHDVAAAGEDINLHGAHGEHDLAALGNHGIEVQIVTETLPQFQRKFEKSCVAADHVVGTDQRGIAADIAGADVGFLQHGDIPHSVILGEVIGRGKAMAAAADDNGIIAGFRLWLGPGFRPWFRRPERVPCQRKNGISFCHAP